MSRPSTRDPLGPLGVISGVILSVLVASLTIVVLFAAVGVVRGDAFGVSVAGIGDPDPCIETTAGAAGIATSGGYGRGVDRSEASVNVDDVRICLTDATWWQDLAGDVEPVGQLALVLAAVVLLRRIIRAAREEGPFTDGVAARVRHLAWLLLGQALVWPFVVGASRGVALEEATGQPWHGSLLAAPFSVLLLVVAVGVLTVARVLRLSVPMQDEIDALV